MENIIIVILGYLVWSLIGAAIEVDVFEDTSFFNQNLTTFEKFWSCLYLIFAVVYLILDLCK